MRFRQNESTEIEIRTVVTWEQGGGWGRGAALLLRCSASPPRRVYFVKEKLYAYDLCPFQDIYYTSVTKKRQVGNLDQKPTN